MAESWIIKYNYEFWIELWSIRNAVMSTNIRALKAYWLPSPTMNSMLSASLPTSNPPSLTISHSTQRSTRWLGRQLQLSPVSRLECGEAQICRRRQRWQSTMPACVISTLLYDNETWTTYAGKERRLNTFHLRSIIRWALGRRTTGRHHLPYKDVCVSDMKAVDIDTMSWESLAADRTQWRSALKQHPNTGEDKLMTPAMDKRARRKEGSSSIRPETTHRRDVCNKDCYSQIGLFRHKRRCSHPATHIKHNKKKKQKTLGCIIHDHVWPTEASVMMKAYRWPVMVFLWYCFYGLMPYYNVAW